MTANNIIDPLKQTMKSTANCGNVNRNIGFNLNWVFLKEGSAGCTSKINSNKIPKERKNEMSSSLNGLDDFSNENSSQNDRANSNSACKYQCLDLEELLLKHLNKAKEESSL